MTVKKPRKVQQSNHTAKTVRIVLQAPKHNGHGKKKLSKEEQQKLSVQQTIRKIMED